MEIITLLVFAVIFYAFSYKVYGNSVAKKLPISINEITPAHKKKDGVDYVPASFPVLFGHHFASIAGAGPIVGPIIAASFGWFPVYVWLLLGAVFIGGVHDYTALVASLKHGGRSIGQIIKQYIGLKGKRMFLVFCWATLILVIAVFTNIVADTFVRSPQAATSSALFILLALGFGLINYRFKLSNLSVFILALPLIVLAIWFGNNYPLVLSRTTWQLILFAYIFIASVAPVWLLLQPRDYLNSFLLYALILGAFTGVFFASPILSLEGFKGFSSPNLGFIFPVLFVTVACGAISGFHSMVSSGTTSKQLNKVVDAKRIGYGAMLLEGVLAVLALLAVASLPTETFENFYRNKHFVPAFAEGVGNFITSIPLLKISLQQAITFTSLAVSAFALTSLDTCTRLARLTLQELLETENIVEAPRANDIENMTSSTKLSVKLKSLKNVTNLSAKFKTKTTIKQALSDNRYFATFVTVLFGALLTFSGKSDSIWPVFGSANQLLATFSLLAVTCWLISEKKPFIFTLVPTIFMFVVTSSALVVLTYTNLFVFQNYLLAVISLLLLIISFALCLNAYSKFKQQIYKC